MSLEIEFEPATTSRCDCCGGSTTSLTRFVRRDGDAWAVYRAAFSDNHPDGSIGVLIGLGEWGDDASPDQRTAFAVEIRAINDRPQVMVTDAARSPWRKITFLGRIVDRAEGLAHPLLSDVFHLTDHIVADDDEIRGYLERTAQTS